MAGARYVLLGLAPVRAPWFRDVAQWANASSIPAEFIKCVSAAEVRSRLAGGRSFSALLVDAAAPALDRDLVEAAQQHGSAVIVIGDRRGARDWTALGANATLGSTHDRKDLLEVLTAHCTMIGRAEDLGGDGGSNGAAGGVWQAPMAAVCGPGGTGASTAAIALAQGLAGDIRSQGAVVLADLALNGDQAMFHDARDIVPGIQELVEVCRSGHPSVREVRSLAWDVTDRDYALLLGLRRSRAWATIRPRGFGAALEALRGSYRAVVADVDPDVEGEAEGGSIDVEERHIMARTTLGTASAVFVIGAPGMKGMHSLVRVASELLSFGIPASRLVPVINRAPRAAQAKSQLSATFTSLLPEWASTTSPVFLPERHVEQALRDGVRLPESLSVPLARAFDEVLSRAGDTEARPDHPQRVEPGTLGTWPDNGRELASG